MWSLGYTGAVFVTSVTASAFGPSMKAVAMTPLLAACDRGTSWGSLAGARSCSIWEMCDFTDVTDAYQARQSPKVVDDWQVTDALLRHGVHQRLNRLVRSTGEHLAGHHVRDR